MCSKKAVEDFLGVQSRVVESVMDSFSGNLSVVLVYFLEVGNVNITFLIPDVLPIQTIPCKPFPIPTP